MNLWRALPSYPTNEDLLYEIQTFLIRDGKKEFSDVAMNYIWQDVDGTPNWKDTIIEEKFNALVETGYIVKIDKNSDRQWFKLDQENNPFL